MFIVVLVLLIPLTAVILDSQLARALAARLEKDRGAADEALGTRVAALEAELDRLAKDVQRLEEESDFLHRLLERKPAGGGTLQSGESHD